MPTDFGIAGMGRYTPASTVRKTQSIGTASTYKAPTSKSTTSRSVGRTPARKMTTRTRAKSPTRMTKAAPFKAIPDFQGQAYKRAAPVLRRMGTNPRGGGVIQPAANAFRKAGAEYGYAGARLGPAIGGATKNAGEAFGAVWRAAYPGNWLINNVGDRLKNLGRPTSRRR